MLSITHLSAAINPDYWPAPFWPICFLLFLWTVKFLKIFSYPDVPTVVTGNKSLTKENSVKEVLEKCDILKEK